MLFLDVLFPLNVKKIIFVDADQVVRADMMELMNLDLGGAPYGSVLLQKCKRIFVPVTHRSVILESQWMDSDFGRKDTGPVTWLDGDTTFPLSTLLIWLSSDK